MSKLSATQIKKIKKYIDSLKYDANRVTLESIAKKVLSLNSIQVGNLFIDAYPKGSIGKLSAELSHHRTNLLIKDGRIPDWVIDYDAVTQEVYIIGLGNYLTKIGVDSATSLRLKNHTELRKQLIDLENGDSLEAVAAAMLQDAGKTGIATQRSGDLGVDAIGSCDLFPIPSCLTLGLVESNTQKVRVPHAGEAAFTIVSSKANLGGKINRRDTINPAHIRELIGGWLIQRSDASVLKEQGVLMLSPMQLVLVTTYRLSTNSWRLCHELGVQVWSLPQIIYMICKHSSSVFNTSNTLNLRKFKSWWSSKDSSRQSVGTK